MRKIEYNYQVKMLDSCHSPQVGVAEATRAITVRTFFDIIEIQKDGQDSWTSQFGFGTCQHIVMRVVVLPWLVCISVKTMKEKR